MQCIRTTYFFLSFRACIPYIVYNSSLIPPPPSPPSPLLPGADIEHTLQLLGQVTCIKEAFVSHSFDSHWDHSLHFLFLSLQSLTFAISSTRLFPPGSITYPSSPGPLHLVENFVLHQKLSHLLFIYFRLGREEKKRRSREHNIKSD